MLGFHAVLLGQGAELLALQLNQVEAAGAMDIEIQLAEQPSWTSIDNSDFNRTVYFFSGSSAVENASAFVDTTRLTCNSNPLFVVQSAQKSAACDAYELGALDFLLTSPLMSRLQACIERVVRAIALTNAEQQVHKLDGLLQKKNGTSLSAFEQVLEHTHGTSVDKLKSTICLKSGVDWVRLNLQDILWLEAAGDYVCVYTQDTSHIVCKPLKYFEQQLCSDIFKRISRSVIVNLANVDRIAPNQQGALEAHIKGDVRVKVGRRYRHQLTADSF
jgi:two-component system LytT family response regulator